MRNRVKRGPGGVIAFVGVIAAALVLSAAWAGIAAAAPGTIEICKSGAHNASGVSFNFSAVEQSNGQTVNVAVVGGTCANPFSAGTGRWDITEDVSSNL